ncbi:hypothetical protein PENSPDRAFT_672558 [Peniophora sp. CONT]|nr:hypothetical protein PENSPDRAFT_672558 [Peniophora sp. CONT]
MAATYPTQNDLFLNGTVSACWPSDLDSAEDCKQYLRCQSVDIVHRLQQGPSAHNLVRQRIYSRTTDTRESPSFAGYPSTPPLRLRELSVYLGQGEGAKSPLILPPGLCSAPYVEYLELNACLRSGWDAPIFSSRLTFLAVRAWKDYDVHLMPTMQELSDILSLMFSLEFLELQDVFPAIVETRFEGPSISLPASLCSMVLLCMSSSTRQRDGLALLGRVCLTHDIHLDVCLDQPDIIGGVDTHFGPTLPSPVFTDLRNIYRCQSQPRHLCLGTGAFLSINAENPHSDGCSWPASVELEMFMDITDATSLITVNFAHTTISAWADVCVGIPGGLTSVTFLPGVASAHLKDESWQRALMRATEVQRVSVHVGDFAALLPLGECVLAQGSFFLAVFPRSETMHIHTGAGSPKTTTEQKEQLYDSGVIALRIPLRSLKQLKGSTLRRLTVDGALRRWTVWSRFESDLQVDFC